MRKILTTLGVLILAIASGCSSKPPPEIDAAVRDRLTRYSDAWQQGDAAGVRESFHARDANEAALRDALAELAPAQAALRTTYRDSLGTIGQIVFGDVDPATLVIAPRQWDSYARAAAHPHQLIYEKPDVVARLDERDEDMTLRLRNADGGWKIDVDSFLMGDDASQLAQATRRQVRHASELIEAMRSRDPSRVRQVMLRQVVEARGPSRGIPDEILMPATTRAAATGTKTGAKENPP
jgi:hypothetical protein